MDFFSHVAELRTRIIRCFLALLVSILFCFAISDYLLSFISYPFEKSLKNLTANTTTNLKNSQNLQIEDENIKPPKKNLSQGQSTSSNNLTELPSKYSCICQEIRSTDQFSNGKTIQDVLPKDNQTPDVNTDQSLESNASSLNLNNFQTSQNSGQSSSQKNISCVCELADNELKDTKALTQALDDEAKTSDKVTQNLNKTDESNNFPSGNKKTENGPAFIFLDLTEVFLVKIKIAFWSALFLLFPYLIGEIWGFVAPAMYKKEKKILITVIIGSYVCFIGGAVFTYLVVFPAGFEFFLGLADESLASPTISLAKYLDFALLMLFVFGIFFEMPVLCLVLAQFGVIDAPMMLKNSRIVIVLIFFVAAVFTPPDPLSMLMLAFPMVGLYFLSYALIGLKTGFK